MWVLLIAATIGVLVLGWYMPDIIERLTGGQE